MDTGAGLERKTIMRRRLVLLGVLLALLVLPAGGQALFTTIQDAQTTGNGTAIDRRGDIYFVIVVEWSSGTTAGVITIEEAAETSYAGTWSSLATVTWSAESSTEMVHLGGAAYGAIRARISTTVDNGTVTVLARGTPQ